MIRTTKPWLFAALVACGGAASAQVYTWKDEQGRTVMSDKKPSGKVRDERVLKGTAPDPGVAAATTAAPPASAAAAAAVNAAPGVDPELEKRRKAQEEKARAEAEKQRQERERLAKEQLDTTCKGLRQNLASLDSGLPIARPDEKGEMQFIEDAQRATETAQLRKQIAEICK